jgi:hypothetical protein
MLMLLGSTAEKRKAQQALENPLQRALKSQGKRRARVKRRRMSAAAAVPSRSAVANFTGKKVGIGSLGDTTTAHGHMLVV